ncbi:hypothetical protein [Belnapia sp. F-4-1]|uniref:hypothetical protein n=1 Tax=Belnapia sp. F-4-1 TaxID=1545443 RepID=UPI0005B7FB89|nr:hypothetical protein [Belnapia sp. F-4-1]
MAPRPPFLLPVLGLLGACAAPEERADALRRAFETSRASLAPSSPALAASSTAIPVAMAAMPMTAEPAAARPVVATQFLGLGPEVLRRWLGEPSFRRHEGTAEIWLYAGPACALDLILYPEGGRLRVSHAAARASGAEPRTEAHCLRELAGSPRPADRGA